jgi:uncharacterized membrane protein YccC
MKAWLEHMRLLLRARRGDVRHAIRVSTACALTFAIMRIFNIPGGQWAVFTTIIVIQTNIGGTIVQAVERLIGTMVGAAAGAVAVYAQETSGVDVVLVLTILVAIVAFAAASRPTLRAAPLTAVIMLVAHPLGLDPATAALYRIGEIFLGGVIGVAATLLIFPAHAHAAVVARLAKVLSQLEAIAASHAQRLSKGGAEAAASGFLTETRVTLAEMQTAMGEADRENASRLGDSLHSDATLRTAWRVRNDLVSLGRALNDPLPAPGMIPPGEAVLQAYVAFLAACRLSLNGGPRADRVGFAKAHADFQDAVQALRAAGAMRGIPFDDLAQTFGFVFAVEALYSNLSDLADRLQEADAA